MAGVAWTLHPALFYDKYGPVLIQLWDSGAVSNLFRPVRRLSKTIGKAITSGIASRASPDPVAQPLEEASALHITDESVPTDDEAWSKVNREPGDTSPEPSTSQQNELAFQGDLYTQLRRNRRQQDRIEKIRENRRKFLEGGSGSRFGSKRRGLAGCSGSILSPKKKGAGNKDRGTGTPLADMECVPSVRGVVIDLGITSDSGKSSDSEHVGTVPAAARTQAHHADELLPDNDSLKAFRVPSGRHKRRASPPPKVHGSSDIKSETSTTLSAMKQVGADVDSPFSGEPGAQSSEERSLKRKKKRKATKKVHRLTPPAGQEKSLEYPQADDQEGDDKVSKKIISTERLAKKTKSKAPQKAYKKDKGQAPTSPSITASESGTIIGIASLPKGEALKKKNKSFKGKTLASDGSPTSTVPTEAPTKNDKTKRRKHKARSHKKRSEDKLKAARPKEEKSTEVLHGFPRKGTKQEPSAEDKTELRKLGTWDSSQDKTHHLTSAVEISITSKEARQATATTSTKLSAAKATDIAACPTTFTEQAPMRPSGIRIPSLVTNATPMVHTKVGLGQSRAAGIEDNIAGVGRKPAAEALRSSSLGADPAGENNIPKVGRFERGEGSSPTQAEHWALIKPPSATAAPTEKIHSTAVTSGRSDPPSHDVGKRHKKQPRKRRSKPLAVAEETSPPLTATAATEVAAAISNRDVPRLLTAECTEKTMDEAVASSHHGPLRSRSKKHGRKSKKSRRKGEYAVDLVSAVSDRGGISAKHRNDASTAETTQDTGKPAVSTTQLMSTQTIAAEHIVTAAASAAPEVAPFTGPLSTDLTMSGISSGLTTSEQRPTNVTVIHGDEVKIHLDLTGHNRRSAFWPFGRKSHQKKK